MILLGTLALKLIYITKQRRNMKEVMMKMEVYCFGFGEWFLVRMETRKQMMMMMIFFSLSLFLLSFFWGEYQLSESELLF